MTNYPYEVNDILEQNNFDMVKLLNMLYIRVPNCAFAKQNLYNLKKIKADIFEEVLLKDFGFKPIPIKGA